MSEEGKSAAVGAESRVKAVTLNMDKMRTQVDAFLEKGMFYEAQQLYLTLSNRHMGRKQFKEAIILAVDGALKLLQHKQGNAGGQLALQIIDAFTKGDEPISDENLKTIKTVFDAFPPEAQDSQSQFMKAAVAWTIQKGSNPHGDPTLHLKWAMSFFKLKQYSKAHQHYLLAQTPAQHAVMLTQWAGAGYDDERDLFLARTVFQYLVIQNLNGANKIFSLFKAKFKDGSLDTPLTNFLAFLLKTCERNAGPLFQMLRQKYAIALSRDPSLNPYLDKIAQLYFGIQPPKSMLENLLGGGMLGGMGGR